MIHPTRVPSIRLHGVTSRRARARDPRFMRNSPRGGRGEFAARKQGGEERTHTCTEDKRRQQHPQHSTTTTAAAYREKPPAA